MVTAQLLKSYCLSFLLYGSEAVGMSATNMHILENCINRAMYRIFGIGDRDNVWQLRQFLGLCIEGWLSVEEKDSSMHLLTARNTMLYYKSRA